MGKRTWNPNKKTGNDGIKGAYSNRERAERAEIAISVSAEMRGEIPNADKDSAADLLADIGHWCDREELDFEELIATAKMHWKMER